MKKRIYTLYMHICSINNKKYIGITMQEVNKRWGNGRCYGKSLFFNNAIKKYGWDNFEHEVVLRNLTKEEAEMFEIEMIKYYKTTNPEFGYNISHGGGILSECTRSKISEALKGRVLPQETREKISRSQKGKKLSKEHCDKIQLRMQANHPMKNKTHTEESRLKMSKSRKGVKFSKERRNDMSIRMQENHHGKRRVENITTKKIFGSIKDAAIFYNLNKSHICLVCRGHRKSTGGFMWRYVDI